MYKPPDNNIKEQIFRASSSLLRGNQTFLKTPLALISDIVDLSSLTEECSFVGDKCWLAGGTLVRLLSNHGRAVDSRSYDRDFFFPSRQAMITVFEEMILSGYLITHFNFRKRKIIRRTTITSKELDLPSDLPNKVISHSKVQDILQREDLVTLELLSPKAIRCQLIVGYTGCDPVEIINQFDFTLCQLAIDREYLYSGDNTWNSLITRQLQTTGTGKGVSIMFSRRVYKYMKIGYKPTSRTIKTAIKSLVLYPIYIRK